MTNRIATWDCEANGFLEEATRVWCIALIDHDTGLVSSFAHDRVADGIKLLETYDVLVGHNCIAYDFPLLRKLYGWEYNKEKRDTLLMSRTQRPQREVPPSCPSKMQPHSVETWGYRLGMKKQEHTDWTQYSPEMLERCVQDVRIQAKIYEALLKEEKEEGWEHCNKLNAKLFHYLQKQEEYGWLIDREHLERCLIQLDTWISRIDLAVVPRLPLVVDVLETKKDGEYGWVKKPFKRSGELSNNTDNYRLSVGLDRDVIVGPFSRISFRPVDLNSNQEVKDYLLTLGWKPTEWNTNNENKRTSPKFSKDDEFEGIQGNLGKLIAKRIQCRQRKSVLQGWKASIRDDGRIASKVAGMATTGRIRHSGIVNVPSPGSKAFYAKQMRQVFSCRPGWVLIGTDSKSNQIRQLAARMGDAEFTEAVLNGDPHSLNQRRVGGDVSRNAIKAFFYSLIFGAQDGKIAKILKITRPAAKKIRDDYLNGMPKLKELLERETKAWRESAQRFYNPKYNRVEYRNGYIRGLDGRPILVEEEHTILVYYLQSDEAIQMATAYCILNKWLERRGYAWGKDYGFVIWMHDEWQLECRQELVDEIIALSNEAIAWAGHYYKIAVPHEGESKIGKNWKETH